MRVADGPPIDRDYMYELSELCLVMNLSSVLKRKKYEWDHYFKEVWSVLVIDMLALMPMLFTHHHADADVDAILVKP